MKRVLHIIILLAAGVVAAATTYKITEPEMGSSSPEQHVRMRIIQSMKSGDDTFYILKVGGSEYLTQSKGGFIKLN
jgi:hypothetical protein